MLILTIIGKIALALLTTLALVFVFLYLLSKSLDWLDLHYGAKIRQLTKPSFPDTSNDDGSHREESEYLIYYHYLSQHTRRIIKWVSDPFQPHIQRPTKSRDTQHSKADTKGFLPMRVLRDCTRPWHRLMLNRLARIVNQSGKEPREKCSEICSEECLSA